MKILGNRKLYLPAFSIVAVVVILLVFIGFSTYRNLNKSRTRAMALVHRQGVAIVQAVEAGARAGMFSPMWEQDSIARLIVETAKSEDIAYIYLVGADGNIEHHSTPSEAGKKAGWIVKFDDDQAIQSRFIRHSGNSPVYELAKKFTPLSANPSEGATISGTMTTRRRMHVHTHEGAVLVAGLKMDFFEQARKQDIRHAALMAVILAALGSGALYFIFVIQNYYLVDRTLEQTRDYARQVVASMASGLISTDTEGKILSYNSLAMELLDIDEKRVDEISMKNVIDFAETGVCDTMSGCKAVLDKEITHERSDGEKIPLAVSATPILEESGKCGGAVLIFRDLREIKRLEKRARRAEKLAAMGQLSAAVAHEIRNPLSSIRGFAQFLAHVLKDKPADREYAEIMVKEIDRIDQVVTDLLTFARPLESKKEPADIVEIVDHAIRLVKPELAAKNVLLRKQFDENLKKAPVDKDQITQVLLNLTLNALDVTPAGSQLSIGASFDGKKGEILVWVEDEGPGIAPENQKSAFDPFFTTKEKGTGLGLSIVKKIVENHEGRVFIASPPPGKNRGARVGFGIPAAWASTNENGEIP